MISGLRGPDFINGRGAADELYGGKGNDEIHGKCGSDYISGGRGFDVLRGGAGNDRIEAADGKHDFINCGPGDADRVSADREAEGAEDRVKNCEYINGQLLEKPPVVEPPTEESQAQE